MEYGQHIPYNYNGFLCRCSVLVLYVSMQRRSHSRRGWRCAAPYSQCVLMYNARLGMHCLQSFSAVSSIVSMITLYAVEMHETYRRGVLFLGSYNNILSYILINLKRV